MQIERYPIDHPEIVRYQRLQGPTKNLTPRQRVFLSGVGRGLSDEQIASEMHVTIKGVGRVSRRWSNPRLLENDRRDSLVRVMHSGEMKLDDFIGPDDYRLGYINDLSPKEREILEAAEEHTMAGPDLAGLLSVSLSTIKMNLENIRCKLQASDTLEAVMILMAGKQSSLLSPEENNSF